MIFPSPSSGPHSPTKRSSRWRSAVGTTSPSWTASVVHAGNFAAAAAPKTGLVSIIDGSDAFPAAALAAARGVVRFTENPEPTARFDLTPYSKADAILSSTGELAWNAGIAIVGESLMLSRGEERNGRPTGPVLMEPVAATIRFKHGGNPVVHILDHNGVKTGRTLAVKNGISRSTPAAMPRRIT